MTVWQLTANEIGPNDCGAMYFATKREADLRYRDYRLEHEDIFECTLEKLVIKDRKALARALNDAMGFGGN